MSDIFLLYEYDNEGYHNGYIEVSEENLSKAFQTIIKKAKEEGRKVIITDLGDMCVFHMEGGKVIFPSVEALN